ncbi:hypothetical protein V1634_27075 [Plantactinospora veratri]|uniref:Uncharacterized protein n=1 Tax=Plantactinospora veratri TaxID=1436122 RepID=A0ABU7SKL5_9ACTN
MGTRIELSELVRAIARRDWGSADRLTAELDQLGWQGAPQVIGAAFAIAVNDRFDSATDVRDIARYVSDIRGRYQDGNQLSALDVEGMIRAALGEVELADSINPEVAFQVQIFVLGNLLHDADLTEPQLEEFISQVEQAAARFM